MKDIKVTGCRDCPFLNTDIDYDANGHSHVETCILARHLEPDQEYFIMVHDGEKKVKTPDWCPLKKEAVSICFEE